MLTSLLARNVPVAKYVSTDYYVVRNLSNELIAKWACNAHKIRQIRHLRGVIARCTSKKIRAIGAIRELLYNKVQISSLLLSQLVCHSGKGNCPVKLQRYKYVLCGCTGQLYNLILFLLHLAYFAVCYIEQFIVVLCGGKYAVEVFAAGVCNEYLSKVLVADIRNDAFHAVGIEFVEDVVKQ